jgi:hypothetical protein
LKDENQKMALPKLNPTTLSQYIRLENCERYLRFSLVKEDVYRLERKWGITAQPLTPLLKESGTDFEQNIAKKLAARGETVINLEEYDLDETLQYLQGTTKPTILYQLAVEAPIGPYPCRGRVDLLHLRRDRSGGLRVLVADIKATRKEKTEHRLQVATYAWLIAAMANEHGFPISAISGAVLTQQDDGSYPTLGPQTETFELDTYLSLIERLVIAEDSVVDRVLRQPFDKCFYNLNYKCDGCYYNSLCMYYSAENQDISLTPYIKAVEKRVLNDVGIKTLAQLAALMGLPETGGREMQPSSEHQDRLEILNNRWPVAPNLPFLVQRARAALRNFDSTVDSRTFIYGSGFGTLPSDDEYPGLVKVFFDAQRDYLQDRLYLISALVSGPAGQRVIVKCADRIPNDEIEKSLLIEWIQEVIKAAREVSRGDTAPLHLYSYNRYDQKVLLEAHKRHLTEVASIPAFFDLMTQSAALNQPIISFLADEVQDRGNIGRVCAPLHDVARWFKFDWQDEDYQYYALFRARMFDNRRTVAIDGKGEILHYKDADGDKQAGKLRIESASRFHSQIPLEYAYAAWHSLPESKEGSHVLEPFRQVDLKMIKSFAAMRVKALAHIEGSFKNKARFLKKVPIHIPHLTQSDERVDLAQSLREFLYMEHHTSLQEKLLVYSYPIERRVQSGLAMLLRFRAKVGKYHRFTSEFASIGLDPRLTLDACKLKEGDWVVLNSTEEYLSANQIKHGRLAIIAKIDQQNVDLELLNIAFRGSNFRFFHVYSLEPESGKYYTLDQMADDLNADKILDALGNVSGNTFFNWLREKPPKRESLPESANFLGKFTDMIDDFLKNRNRKLTKPQRSAIADQFDQPLVLIQGPPGTGKSYTLAWAILARIAAQAIQGKPCRVLISCKTHNAINVVLEALSQAQSQIKTFAPEKLGGRSLRILEIFKAVNNPDDVVPDGVKPIIPYNIKSSLETLFRKPYVVFGATSGGLYNMMRYRPLGGNCVDWQTKTFDLVVNDEASQMSLPEAVLSDAFLKSAGSMIVVGDHRQMPPIITHPWKEEQKRSVVALRPYISLFEGLVERDFPQVKLDESFRLHTLLAEFLRINIYSKDGINFHSRRRDLIKRMPNLDQYVDAVMRPEYPIVVIEHTEQASQQYNPVELELVRPLIGACVNHLRLDGRTGVGIVVPHRAQKALLRAEFPDLAEVNSIDTVERFQGDERDVIIVSATASDPDYVLNEADFLLNLNRLNVAISRPRMKLIVLASRSVIDLLTSDLEVFEQSVIWKRLYHHYTPDILLKVPINGFSVTVRGRKVDE